MREEDAILEAATLLTKLRAAARNPKTVLQATMELVAGQPAARAADCLTVIRAEIKESGLSGDSSVGTIRAACKAIADNLGPNTPIPRWRTAEEARKAQRAAAARSVGLASSQGIDAEIRRLAKIVLRLPGSATDGELLRELRRHADLQQRLAR